jgi:filamentous hemagglutinin family protein
MRNAYLQLCDYTSRFRILKGGKISLVVSALLAGTTLCFSAPTGGVVTSGTASIASSGSTTTISQSSTKASINWTSFSIAASETVNFVQPSVSSITLNRVVGNEASVIAGALNANGQVWILNSNGVLFNSTASINTAGLLASTMNLSDADFQAGNYSFSGESTASVINQGTITISDAGYAALFGKEVSNEGVIKATLGSVELVGASAITLNLNGNSLVNLTVDKGVLDALVENKGAIYADGGTIYLTTNAVNELLAGVVNNTGILQANSIDDITGEIILYAHGGTTNVSGTLSAKEGFIETSGETLHVNSDVSLQAKEWLLDPTDITITDGGSDSISGSSIDADTITTVLNNGTNVTLTAADDITVNENITWSSATKLTLSASDEIYVNATIANTNSTYGGVYFNAANTTDKVIFGTNGLVMVYNVYQLQWINTALQGIYELGGNIDASETSTWNSSAGFVPIGDSTNQFTGTLDGNGYVIDGLTIYLPSTYYVGLIGYAGSGAVIENIGLTDVDITGYDYVGGLVGQNDGTITNSYATGSVSGDFFVGGLVGLNIGTITDSYATGSVSGTAYVGGLVGGHTGTINNAYATGSVSGSSSSDYVGGLVGYNRSGTITDSYATNSVSGTEYVGGLVGYNESGTITDSYSTGSVIGTTAVGGLVGVNIDSGTITDSYSTGSVSGGIFVGGLVGANSGDITDSYATGSVSGTDYVGGLVGYNDSGTITDSYSTGSVSGTADGVGGLVGYNDSGTITASFWNTQTSGQSSGIGGGDTSSGVSGKTTAQMQTLSTYTDAGWDIAGIDGAYPTLTFGTGSNASSTWQMVVAVSYSLSDLIYTYTGTTYTLSDLWSTLSLFGSSYSSWVYGVDYVFLDSSGTVVTSYTNAGTYSNLYIDILKSGYTEATSGNTVGSLTITPASLTVTATSASKTYDGTAYSGGAGVTYSGFVASEDASVLSGTLTYSGDSQGATDVGAYTISVSGLSSGNYTLSFVDGVLSINAVASTASTTPSVAHIENGTATRSPFFASDTTRDTLTQITQTEALQEIITQASSDTTKVPLWPHSLIQLVGGGIHLPDGLEDEYVTAQ